MENRTIAGLYMGWRESAPHLLQQWIPVMYVTWDEQKRNYYHSYTHGFEANYERLKGDIYNPESGYTKLWHLKHIYGVFSNRVPKREDTLYIYDLLDIPEAVGDTITYLSRSLGKTNNSDFDFFPQIAPNEDGEYEFYFSLLDLAPLSIDDKPGVRDFVKNVQKAESLDCEIKKDKTEIIKNGYYIGYCPDYIHFFLTKCSINSVKFQVEKVNATYRNGKAHILVKCSIKTDKNKDLYSHTFLKPLNVLTEKLEV